MFRYQKMTRAVVAALFLSSTAVTVNVATQASAANRRFNLVIANGTNAPLSLRVATTSRCYESFPGLGAVMGPLTGSKTATMNIARVQGNGCDGENGSFSLVPTSEQYNGEGIGLSFTNDGGLWINSLPNSFKGVLSAKRRDESYLLTIIPTLLGAPVNAALSTPRNRVASDAGDWGTASTKVETYQFLNQPKLGLWGNFYDDCVGVELFHTQHVVRLANKNGRAYFVVAQSRAHNGWISVLETNPGVLDANTDLLVPKAATTRAAGRYIWQDLYNGSNPVGNWNHPGKMEVVGDVLMVAAQNWAEGAPCFYGAGSTIDKVLFYDVRDPARPRYWGAIDSAQLGVKEISTVGLVREPNGDYLLTAGGDGSYTTWTARSVSPDIKDWQRVTTDGFSGQHGMMFNSSQQTTRIGAASAPAGTERVMYFDSANRNSLNFTEYGYQPTTHTIRSVGTKSYPFTLPGADRHWDSDSLYVSTKGMPVIYSMQSVKGETGYLYQLPLSRQVPVDLTLSDIAGSYTHTPVQNDWHYVTVTVEGDRLRWNTKAGPNWVLTPDLGRQKLVTGPDNPYYKSGFRDVKLNVTNGRVVSMEFANTLYVRQ